MMRTRPIYALGMLTWACANVGLIARGTLAEIHWRVRISILRCRPPLGYTAVFLRTMTKVLPLAFWLLLCLVLIEPSHSSKVVDVVLPYNNVMRSSPTIAGTLFPSRTWRQHGPDLDGNLDNGLEILVGSYRGWLTAFRSNGQRMWSSTLHISVILRGSL